MELNEEETLHDWFQAILNEVKYKSAEAGHSASRGLGFTSRAVGGQIGSGMDIARETERLKRIETAQSGQIQGQGSEDKIDKISVGNLNREIQDKALQKQKQHNAALLNHNSNPTVVTNKTGSPAPTVSVASQNKPPQQTSTPTKTPSTVKSPLPAGHNNQKQLKRIKTVGPLKTYRQMFPKNK